MQKKKIPEKLTFSYICGFMPNIQSVLFVALGGALGSVLRFLVSLFFLKWQYGFPFGTFAVNLLGSFLIGVLFVVLPKGSGQLLFVTGFCGGFTTFSTFSLETFVFIEKREWMLASYYVFGSVFLGILFVFLGLKTGTYWKFS